MSKHIRKRSSSIPDFNNISVSSQETDNSSGFRASGIRPASAPVFYQSSSIILDEDSSPPDQPHLIGSVSVGKVIDGENLKRSLEEHSSNDDAKHPKLRRLDNFKFVLDRIQELQQSIDDEGSCLSSDEECDLQDHLESIIGPNIAAMAPRIDPETLGFLACAQETMKYLSEHGMARDHPIVVSLRKRLIEGINRK